MRRGISASSFAVALLVLVTGSVALKASVGTVNDGKESARPFELEDQLAQALRAQHFGTAIRPLKFQSAIVTATRGDCRLSVRDARAGTAIETAFARDAAAIGPVRYLYRGKTSANVPSGRLRFDRLQTELLAHVGVRRQIPVVVALATSPGCGNQDFGFNDVRLPA